MTVPHVLYVITDLEVGGVPLHLLRLARVMRERGFHVTVASLAPAGPVGRMLDEAGISVQSCEGRGGWDFRVIPRLASMIRELRPDVVHTFLFHANLAGRWAAASAGISPSRVVCEIQTVEVERRWHLWVDRCTFDGCRFIIGNSPSVIEHLAMKGHVPQDWLRLVHGGIDPEPIRTAAAIDRESLGVPCGPGMVLWVGRMDPVKGLSSLLDAFFGIADCCDAHLVLVGDGSLRESLEDHARDMALGSRVHFLGARRDVPRLLKAANLFVFPSRTEGLPNALLEAMAAERPIVATDVPGCRDLIEHERNGLLVPYGDTEGLGAAMHRLLSDATFARALGARAAEDVERKWRISKTYAEYQGIYSEILGGERGEVGAIRGGNRVMILISS